MDTISTALRMIAVATLPRLRDKVTNGQVPRINVIRLSLSDDGLQRGLQVEPDLLWAAAFTPQDLDEVMSDTAFQAAVAHLFGAAWFPTVTMTTATGEAVLVTSTNTARHNTDFILQRIAEIVGRESIDSLTPERAAELLELERERWTSAEVRFRASVPLLQLRLVDEQPIQLEDDIWLAPFPSVEKAEHWNPLGYNFARLDIDELASAGARIVREYSLPRAQHLRFEGDIRPQVWAAITALRLLGLSHVGASITLDEALGPVIHGSSAMGHLPEFALPGIHFGASELQGNRVPAFLNLYRKLRQVQGSKHGRSLVFALRRFNLSHSRSHADDVLVDLAVALEATVLSGDTQELRFRLSQRGAALLRKQRDPTETYAGLRLLYDVRSKIVHEGRTIEDLSGDYDLAGSRWGYMGFAHWATQLTRDALTLYVDRVSGEEPLQRINEEIDKSILDGLRVTS